MVTSKYDKVLKLIAKNNSLYKLSDSHLDDEALKELMQEGLIRRNEKDDYFLTSYGEVIQIMGYESHKKQKVKKSTSAKVYDMNNLFLYIPIILFFLTGIVIFFLIA